MSKTKHQLYKQIHVSPTGGNLYLNCANCWWLLQNVGWKRPSGPFPSLPNGVDAILKEFLDYWRDMGSLRISDHLPHDGDETLFPDKTRLEEFRNFRRGLVLHDDVTDATFQGAVDDLAFHNGKAVPLEFKTKGSAINAQTLSYYQLQLDAYGLLLSACGFDVETYALIAFWIPRKAVSASMMEFDVTVVKAPIDPSRALAVFRDAVACARGPQPKVRCQFCCNVTT